MLSVVMPCFNTKVIMEKAIRGIIENTDVPFEFILVDNKPPYDDVTPFLENLAKNDVRVRVITKGENIGCHQAMNFGFSESKGEYLVKIDDDTEVPEKWASKMIACLEKCEYLPFLAANCTAKQPWATHMVDHGDMVTEELWPNEKGIVGFPCVMFRRETWERWPKFENNRLYGGEEHFYKAEASKRGLKIALLREVFCYHWGGYAGSDPVYMQWKKDYGYYNTTNKNFVDYKKEKQNDPTDK